MRLISRGLTPDGVDGDIHCTFRRPPCVSLDDRLYDGFFFEPGPRRSPACGF